MKKEKGPSAADCRMLDTHVKAVLKLRRKIEPLKAELDNELEDLKAHLRSLGMAEYTNKVGKATITVPTKTTWNMDALRAALTGEEFDQYCERVPCKSALTERRGSDQEFATRIAGCFLQEDGQPALTVKAL